MRKPTFLIGLAMISAAAGVQAVEGEFCTQCTMGLAMQKHVSTDCSVNWIGDNGKTYCFSNEEAKGMFLKDPEGNLKKAQGFYTSGGCQVP